MSYSSPSSQATECGLEDKDEFDDASELSKVFCQQISETEFENQGISETESALKDLMGYLDSHPEEFEDLLKKRKRQDLENGGMISFLKVRVMDVIHGSNSPLLQVTSKEREKKLKEMKHNMQKAFDYTLECKGRRISKRLEEKREKNASTAMTQSKKTKKVGKTSMAAPPPPPPPPPPPLPTGFTPQPRPADTNSRSQTYDLTPRRPFRPLEERLNRNMHNIPSSVKKCEDADDSFGSIAPVDVSLTSLHQELLSSNPWKRLKCVDENRSPGGTPSNAKKSLKMETPKEPLYLALMNKFRNVRSPSPIVQRANTSQINENDVTTESGFTP